MVQGADFSTAPGASNLLIFRSRPGGAQMATCPSVEHVTSARGAAVVDTAVTSPCHSEFSMTCLFDCWDWMIDDDWDVSALGILGIAW